MTAPYVIEFTLAGLPATPNDRLHWASRSRQNGRWKRDVCLMIGAKRPPKPLLRARLTLTRLSAVEPDPDNLAASFKPVIDALRYAGVLADDKRANVGTPDFRWERAPAKSGGIRVRVEELRESDTLCGRELR